MNGSGSLMTSLSRQIKPKVCIALELRGPINLLHCFGQLELGFLLMAREDKQPLSIKTTFGCYRNYLSPTETLKTLFFSHMKGVLRSQCSVVT